LILLALLGAAAQYFMNRTVHLNQQSASHTELVRLQNAVETALERAKGAVREEGEKRTTLTNLLNRPADRLERDGFVYLQGFRDNADERFPTPSKPNTDIDATVFVDLDVSSQKGALRKRVTALLRAGPPPVRAAVDISGDLDLQRNPQPPDAGGIWPSLNYIIRQEAGCSEIPALLVLGDVSRSECVPPAIQANRVSTIWPVGDVYVGGEWSVGCSEPLLNTQYPSPGPTPGALVTGPAAVEKTTPLEAGVCGVPTYEAVADIVLTADARVLVNGIEDPGYASIEEETTTCRAGGRIFDFCNGHCPLFNGEPHWHICTGEANGRKLDGKTIYSPITLEFYRQHSPEFLSRDQTGTDGTLATFNPRGTTFVSERDVEFFTFWAYLQAPPGERDLALAYNPSPLNPRKGLFIAGRNVEIGNVDINKYAMSSEVRQWVDNGHRARFRGMICAEGRVVLRGGYDDVRGIPSKTRDNFSGIPAGSRDVLNGGAYATPVFEGPIIAAHRTSAGPSVLAQSSVFAFDCREYENSGVDVLAYSESE
jgi:hypothetical protein